MNEETQGIEVEQTEESNGVMDRAPELAMEYISVFSEYSYNNELYGLTSYHNLLGQILKNKKINKGAIHIDCRVHLFLIQASGTGKSAPVPFITNVCSDLGINFNSVDEVTDAALVGTTEPREYTDDEGNTQEEWVEEKGTLANADLVHFDEGDMIFKQNQHNQNMLSYFTKAMNPIGSGSEVINKDMAHGSVSVEPDCSFFMTSYNPTGVKEDIIRTGFFQRIMVFPRDITTQQRKNNTEKDASVVGTETSIEAEYDNLVSKLKEIDNYYNGEDEDDEGQDIKINQKMRNMFQVESKRLYDMLQGADRATKEILESFVPRLQNQMYILAYHSAASDLRDKVEMGDIWYASNLVSLVFGNMITWLEMKMDLNRRTGMKKEKNYWDRMMRNWGLNFEEYENSAGFVSKNVLKDRLPELFGVTEPTVEKYLRIFAEDRYWFKKKTVNKTVYYRPNEQIAPTRPNRKS